MTTTTSVAAALGFSGPPYSLQSIPSPAVGDLATVEGYYGPGDLGGGSFFFEGVSSSRINAISGATLAITGASSTTPIVITSIGHGYVNGQKVAISSVGGNTAANGTWVVTVMGTNTFSLNGSVWVSGAYTSGGWSDTTTVTTLSAHGLPAGQSRLLIAGVAGATEANGTWSALRLTTTTFSIDVKTSTYASGGYIGDGGISFPSTAGTGRWVRIFSGAIGVRWYGAKGDGSTDDTAAIQATCQAACSSTGDVEIPYGRYVVSDQINITAGIRIDGCGVIFFGFPATLASPVSSHQALFNITASNVKITGITIDGTGGLSSTATGTRYAVYAAGTSNAPISNLLVSSVRFSNLLGGVTIVAGPAAGPATHAIYTSYVDDVLIHGCTFYTIQGAAIFIAFSKRPIIESNTIRETAWYSVELQQAVDGAQVLSNRITGVGSAIRCWGASINLHGDGAVNRRCIVRGNYISGVHTYSTAIDCESVHNADIDGNVIDQPTIGTNIYSVTANRYNVFSHIRIDTRTSGSPNTNFGPSSGMVVRGNTLIAGGAAQLGVYIDAQDGGTGSVGRLYGALVANNAMYSPLVQGSVALSMTRVVASGTSPPGVYVSGTPSAAVTNLRVEVNDISGGTAVGQAKFRWSTDGGTTWTSGVTTAASNALGGAGLTGLTVHFQTGPYAADNVYLSQPHSGCMSLITATGTAPPVISVAGTPLMTDGANGTGIIQTTIGTSPPPVAIVGAPANTVTGIRVEVNDTTGGTGLGFAKFRWSQDNGATWAATGVTTIASYALGATGMTLLFPTGPYTDDNIYLVPAPVTNLRVEITTCGTLASTNVRFRWSPNGGDAWYSNAPATASPIALGNTGLTLGFSAGTYTNDNVYTSAAQYFAGGVLMHGQQGGISHVQILGNHIQALPVGSPVDAAIGLTANTAAANITDVVISGNVVRLMGTPTLSRQMGIWIGQYTTRCTIDHNVVSGFCTAVRSDTSGIVGLTYGKGNQLSSNLLDFQWGTRPKGSSVTKTTTYTAVFGDRILADATAADFTITLPANPSYYENGEDIFVKKINSTHTVTIVPSSGTIDGAANKTISTQYKWFTIAFDGTNWYVANAG